MNVMEFLDEKKINYELCSHRPVFTAQHMAAEEHIPGQFVAKPVIVQADGKYYMCVLPACCKINLEKLRQQLGAGELELASEREMSDLFPDVELGAEPPLGTIYGIPTIMDAQLRDDEYLLFQAGTHDQAIKVKRQDYEDLVKPRILDFSYHMH